MKPVAGVLVLAGCLWSGAVLAQSQPKHQTPPPGPHAAPLFEQKSQQNLPTPLFTLAVPVGVDAPVRAPYCNCAYRDFAGQPMTGRDAIVAQAIGHTDQ